MDENEIQRKRRENEEQATKDRARILGLPYLDTRDFEATTPLIPDLLDKSEMHRNFIIPLQRGDDETPYAFMITSQTPKVSFIKCAEIIRMPVNMLNFF